MADWFRNREWDADIAAAFETRLGRARDKAQYLAIQAYSLLSTHPDVAAALCRRAIETGDPAQAARAGLYLGTALAVQGDVDGAIDALEGAIAAEQREPRYRTAAHLDQALLVALARRADLYDQAWIRLEPERALPLADQQPSAQIAWALIGRERGEQVASVAVAALEVLRGDMEMPSSLPAYVSVDEVTRRLEQIAAR